MNSEDQVIHDGKLMPVSQAWVEMMREFPQHGYTQEHISTILERAHAATQNLLACIAKLPEREGAIQLEWALRADAQAAERWRSQWQGYKPKVSEETYGEKLARYQRDMALQGIPQYQDNAAWEKERQKRSAAWEKELEQVRAHHQAQVRRGVKAWRKRKPPKKVYLYEYEYREPMLTRGGTQNAMLNLLNDHHYVELMFEHYSRSWMAPL
jgi:hypothetical protein